MLSSTLWSLAMSCGGMRTSHSARLFHSRATSASGRPLPASLSRDLGTTPRQGQAGGGSVRQLGESDPAP